MVDLKTFGIPKGQDRYHEEIVYSLALLYNSMITAVENYLKIFNLNTGKLNILMAIKHQGSEEGISQVDISKHLIVTPSNMTKMIDKLENEVKALEEEVAKPNFYQQEANVVTARLQALTDKQQELEKLFARWAELDGMAN